MNGNDNPAASLLTEHFDSATLALRDELDVELPEFGNVDLDVAYASELNLANTNVSASRGIVTAAPLAA